MQETKNCPKCGGTMYHNKGIGKQTKKPYENWKCSSCKDIEWVSSSKEPTWSPKILKAEENVKIDQILEAIKIMHHNIICLHKKINDIIAKSGDIPVLDEKEGDEDIVDQDDIRNL